MLNVTSPLPEKEGLRLSLSRFHGQTGGGLKDTDPNEAAPKNRDTPETRRSFDDEFKRQAVALMETGRPVRHLARELEVKASMLYEWKCKCGSSVNSMAPASPGIGSIQEENLSLKPEGARLRNHFKERVQARLAVFDSIECLCTIRKQFARTYGERCSQHVVIYRFHDCADDSCSSEESGAGDPEVRLCDGPLGQPVGLPQALSTSAEERARPATVPQALLSPQWNWSLSSHERRSFDLRP